MHCCVGFITADLFQSDLSRFSHRRNDIISPGKVVHRDINIYAMMCDFSKVVQGYLTAVLISICHLECTWIVIIKVRWNNNRHIIIEGIPVPRRAVLKLKQSHVDFFTFICTWNKKNRACTDHLPLRIILKGLRPVLEGFVVTMREGACEQEVATTSP